MAAPIGSGGGLPEDLLRVPDEQKRRQAVDSLRGYVYQIYQTLLAWLDLKASDTLLLEVAEDYAVLAGNALNAIQVKDTAGSGSLTLRSPDVSAAVQSLWNFQAANPNRVVRVNYLTTANIGKEKVLQFPDETSGLVYWQIATRDGVDVEPLRRALLSLDLPKDVAHFVKQASANQLREKLIRRISWHSGAEDLTLLKQTVDQRLIYLGRERELLSTDMDGVKSALVHKILEVIVGKHDRCLTQADFLRTLDKATTIAMPVASFRKMQDVFISAVADSQAPSMSDGATFVESLDRVPLPPHTALRTELVRELSADLAQTGVLWIHGSSGLGKTVLAQLVARQSMGDWRIVELRGCSNTELSLRLGPALTAVGPSDVRGIILDDLPPDCTSSASLRLAVLVSELGRCGGSLVVTSSKPPPPSLRERIGSPGILSRQIPYLTEEDVGEMVTAAGGDPQLWSKVVFTFCGGGHPQLVAARISGLTHRGWPESELASGLAPLTKPILELDAERAGVRDRLLEELPPQARELLYRLTLVAGRFDRELALALADLDPSIDRPGEAFELLVGPWIESRVAGHHSVSPLLSAAGSQILSSTQSEAIHREIVDHLRSRKPFPGDFCTHLLVHGLASKHSEGLRWLAYAVLLCPHENRHGIADELFILPLLGLPNRPLYPDDPIVSAHLRLAQFCTATWRGDNERVPAILDELFTEARLLKPKAVATTFLGLAISKVLLERPLPVSPARWLPWLRELTGLVFEDATLREHFVDLAPSHPGFDGRSFDQFFFMLQATARRGLSDLSDLFDALHAMDEERRSHLLSALRSPYTGIRLTINSAWLSDHNKGKLNGREAAETYERLASTARTWANQDVEIECICAQAVMLDEFADDSASALRVLKQTRERHSGDPRIARQRAKIFFGRGDYAASFAAVENVVDALSKDEPVDRAYVLRETAISAAETGRFAAASQLFSAAYRAATEAGDLLLPMAIGLQADNAVVQLQDHRDREAITLAAAALRASEGIKPAASDRHKACLILLGHTILWLLQQRTDRDSKLEITYGCCSNQEPHKEILERQPPPLVLCWCHLAELQLIVDGTRDLLQEFRSRVGKDKLIPLELPLQITHVNETIRTLDEETFLSAVQDYIAVHTYSMKHWAQAEQDGTTQTFIDARIDPCPTAQWNEDPYRAAASHLIAAFLVSAAVQRNLTELFETAARVRLAVGGDRCNLEVFQFLEKSRLLAPGTDSTFVASARVLRDHETPITPNDLFLATCNILWWLRRSPFSRDLSPRLSDLIAERWTRAIDLQRASLRHPHFTVDSIRQALDSSTRGLGKITRIALSAEPAVDHTLPPDFRETLAFCPKI